jgi:tRNA(Ile)-lysidine synthase
VSGGADSTALLALAVASGRPVTAVHVDHGLRATSAGEASAVESLAAAWGAAVEVHRVAVPDGPDLEARARAARHEVLGPDGLWGHTADDQAETVLLRLLRGTGPSGLACMRPDRHPLLGLRRADTRELCGHLGVPVVDDPSNRDPRFDRVRVRHEVLPLLDDVARRDVVPGLARLAEQSAALDDLVRLLAAEVDAGSVAALRAVPVPVAVAALRRWWADETGGLPPPDAAAMDRCLAVVDGSSRACDVTRGWSLRRRQGRLRLESSTGPPPGPSSAGGQGDGCG